MITHRQTVTEVLTSKTKNLTVDAPGLRSVQAWFASTGKGTATLGDGDKVDVPSKGDLFSMRVEVEGGTVDVKSTGRVDIVAVRWDAVDERPDDRLRPVRWVTTYADTGRGLARVQGSEFQVLDGLPYREPVEGHPEDAHYRYVEVQPWRSSIADDWPEVPQSAWLAAWYGVIRP